MILPQSLTSLASLSALASLGFLALVPHHSEAAVIPDDGKFRAIAQLLNGNLTVLGSQGPLALLPIGPITNFDSGGNMCLHAGSAAGEERIVWRWCNGSDEQAWKFYAEGTISPVKPSGRYIYRHGGKIYLEKCEHGFIRGLSKWVYTDKSMIRYKPTGLFIAGGDKNQEGDANLREGRGADVPAILLGVPPGVKVVPYNEM